MFYMLIVNKYGRCAMLFRDDYYKNWIRSVGNDERINLFYPDDDAVSSVRVTPGCNLIGYRQRNFVDRMFTATRDTWSISLRYSSTMDNQMSSAGCWCGKYAH